MQICRCTSNVCSSNTLILNSKHLLTTERLRLRSWKENDIEAILAITKDPEVTKYLKHHKLHEIETIQKLSEKAKHTISEHGYGYFICEHKETGIVMGLVGLNYIDIEAPYFPCYTVSWILSQSFWSNGYATEAAAALIRYGFEACNLQTIYACTTPENKASEKVMQRLNMNFVTTFAFPGMAESDPLQKHVLYAKEK